MPKQDLQVLDTRTLGFEVFLREPVAQAVRSEPAPFNSGPSRDALDNLAYAVHREGMISAPTMGAAAEEQSFRAHALRALVHQVLEHGALGLGMDLDAAVVLMLRPRDIHREGLVLPNLKNPSRLIRTAHLSAAHAGLPGDLLVWARENALADDEPLFFSRQHAADGQRKAIDRVRAWQIVKAASERADVRVLALRATGQGAVGEPAPVHPHLFRHARVRQIVRHTHSLALAQKQAGWARLHTEYLTISDDEVRRLMRDVPE